MPLLRDQQRNPATLASGLSGGRKGGARVRNEGEIRHEERIRQGWSVRPAFTGHVNPISRAPPAMPKN